MNNDAGQNRPGPVAAPAEQEQWYRDQGWWSDVPLGVVIHRRAVDDPEGVAYIGGDRRLTWAAYDHAADALATRLAGAGLERGSRVAVFLPDGPLVHVAYVACERAGVIIVGVPQRAGVREIADLASQSDATMMLCLGRHRDQAACDLVAAVRDLGAPILRHAELDGGGVNIFEWTSGAPVRVDSPTAGIEGRQLTPDELWLLNLTSGTTGLPKCVEQVQNRWFYLVRIAEQAANLNANDVLMSVVPSPYGFGLWTAHFAPAVLGITCVVPDHFDAAATLRAVEKHRVSVLACVTTQFVMMLASPTFQAVDLSSLRVLYTGGERVPPEKAREWEARTNSTILQFYGSNEIGPFSCTTLLDDQELRLTTVGRVVKGVVYRIYDAEGRDITARGAMGQPGAAGPGVCNGYWNDDAANAQLYTRDGYLLMPDLVTVDDEGYVRIAGRKSDVIIRGGKNISAAGVEADVAAHPAVDMVAALAVPDPVFGERVGVVVSLRAPATTLDLEELAAFLAERGVSKECFPEVLIIVEEMPMSIGGKIDKRELKARLAELISHRSVRDR